jgi:hypothetical protein
VQVGLVVVAGMRSSYWVKFSRAAYSNGARKNPISSGGVLDFVWLMRNVGDLHANPTTQIDQIEYFQRITLRL